MSSGYQGSSGSYESSLGEPSAKRHAGVGDFGGPRQVGEHTPSPVHHYGGNGQVNALQNGQNMGTLATGYASSQQRSSRDGLLAPEQLPYSYAITSGSGGSSANSPFAMLQHPIFSETGARDGAAEANNAIRVKPEDSGPQRFAMPSGYGVNVTLGNMEHGERSLAPSELLPPSAYTTDGAPGMGPQTGFAPLQQLPMGSASYLGYAMPSQYSQFPVGMYGPGVGPGSAGVHSLAPGALSTASLSGTSSPPPPNAAHQFSMPMRRPEFVAPTRGAYMPRRHSIAVPSPGHHFGLWAPPPMPDSHEWPTSARSSFTMDDSESNYGADDGSDSDGAEGTSVMVSLRPKDMPPGGPVIEGTHISLLVGPGEHQVKDFNILPINILRINYDSKSSDYIVVHLICDLKMKRTTREIFMTAVSSHHLSHDSKRAVLPALKISQQMLRGRTKGFLFQLRYTLVVDGREVESLHSEPFYLWSNVSQRSFPRHEREAYAMETQDINTKKRRRR